MSIFEYDEEKEMKLIRQDEREIGIDIGRELGREEGKEEGKSEGIEIGLQQGIQFCVEDNCKEHIPESRILEKLQNGFNLSLEDAKRYFEQFRI